MKGSTLVCKVMCIVLCRRVQCPVCPGDLARGRAGRSPPCPQHTPPPLARPPAPPPARGATW